MTSSPIRLMTPGPVPVPDWVLTSCSSPLIHHRSTEFTQILNECFSKLPLLFKTTGHGFILNSSGTGAMDASLINLIPEGHKVITISAGKFGERWHQMAQEYNYKAVEYKIPWGEDIPLDDFKALLKKHSDVSGVLFQACETSTGQKLPVKELCQLIKTHTKASIIVDAITAFACMELPMDELGIDMMLAGSQKAMMLPTGLSFIATSEAALKKLIDNPLPRSYYFNLQREFVANKKGQTQFSSPVQLITPLLKVLTYMENEGLSNIIGKTQQLADQFRNSLDPAFTIFPKSPSPSLTCITPPEKMSAAELKSHLQTQYNIAVGGGQNELKGKVLRIGHMGHLSEQDMKDVALALNELLNESDL